MSQRCFNKQDTHCHLLLGLKELDLSAHSRLKCAQEAIDAAAQDQNLPQVLSTDELASDAISRRINSFLKSDIDCFYCFSTCYKDAKACYEVLEYYSEKIETANKTIYLGLGLHPFNVSSEYMIELNALEILIERIQNHRPDIMPVLGEVGLDKRIEVPLQLQLKFLKDFIAKTQDYKKPYSFHCVRAQNELDALISSFGKDALEVIIHGFNGSYGAAMSCLNKGYKLGLGSSLLAGQNASKFAKIIKDAHIEGLQNTHLLLESDFDGSKTQDYDATLLTKIEHQLQSLTNI
ncbi:TatD family hydrolase [Anaerobiospirillum succiniciproducens]|uniref:TatD family hydrolase n=1 Tax=Anaerobiospirillum succiniciproducens TaxID=13335 RepID=UPI000421874B|nr:TatD family hydrolase [Anaerobiospirillum succiniciproducens]